MQTVGFPYSYSLAEHLRRGLFRETPRYSFWGADRGEVAAWREGLTAALRQLAHVCPDPTPPPEVRLLGQEDRGDHVLARMAIQVAEDLAVPCYQLSPRDPDRPAPAVLLLGGCQMGRSELAGELTPPGATGPVAPAVALCRAGLRVLVPDLPGCDERRDDTVELQATLQAQGDSLAAWVVREALVFLAYLRALPETPPGQVGLVGLSDTVPVALLAAALDPGVKTVAVGGDLRDLRERLFSGDGRDRGGVRASEGFPPGLLPLAELADLATLLAPRPLLLAQEALAAEGNNRTLRLVEQGYAFLGHKPRLETHTDYRDLVALANLATEFLGVWLPAELSDLPDH